ncbi:MAG: hypothetical protein ACREIV_04100, partial [Planctomycetaceae bacterium]
LSGQAHFGDRIDIDDFVWASDTRLLISPTRRFPGLMDFKAPTGEIIGMNADGRATEVLFGWAAGREPDWQSRGKAQVHVLGGRFRRSDARQSRRGAYPDLRIRRRG